MLRLVYGSYRTNITLLERFKSKQSMNGYLFDHASVSLDQGGFQSLRNPSLAAAQTGPEITGLFVVRPYWACLAYWQLWGRLAALVNESSSFSRLGSYFINK